MAYKATVRFYDTENKETYLIGDEYTGKKERIKELSTKDNKVGYPVIEEVAKKKSKKKKETKDSK